MVWLILFENRMDVIADRQAHAPVLGIVDLNTAIALRGPRFLGARPRGQLAIMGHGLALWRDEADRVK